MALSVTEANAVSTRHFDKGKITEQVYDNNVMLDRLRQSNQVIFDGGTKIQHTIRYQTLGDADMVDPDAARVTSQKETRTALELDWRWAKCDISISWEERTFNSGEKKIIDLMADKYKEGMQDMALLISTQFHQAEASRGSYDMHGFLNAVQAASSTYAGIDQDDVSSWNAGLYDTTTTTIALYGTGSLDAGLRACRFRDFPDLMLTTFANASIYASKLQPGERRKPGDGRAGATDLYFQSIPIIADPQANTNIWMFLNTEFVLFFVHPSDNWGIEPWENDPDRIKSIRQLITVVGNFMFTRRLAFGAYTALAS
jgi:hypothetical protein